MAAYVAIRPPTGAGNGDLVLVRDGFAWLAFLLPLVWLLLHRLWLEALAVFALTLLIAAAANYGGLQSAAPLLSLLVSIFVGLEGGALRIAALRRRGWRPLGVVEARDRNEAEIRLAFEDWTRNRADTYVAGSDRPVAAASPASGPALGLLAYPGR